MSENRLHPGQLILLPLARREMSSGRNDARIELVFGTETFFQPILRCVLKNSGYLQK